MKAVLLVASFFALFGGCVTSQAQSPWKQDEFILGTFWDPPYRFKERNFAKDSASFQLARAAYFNLLTGTQNEVGIDRTFEGQKWALRVAHAVGISYLISDARFHPAFRLPFDEETARQVVNSYTTLPQDLRSTMYGYNLGDEPHFRSSDLENTRNWYDFLRKAEPSELVYVNLVASYAAEYNWEGFTGGKKDRILDDEERNSYEEYLGNYLDSLDAMVPSFDHYPFMSDGSVRRDYFYNLDILKKKAGSKPFWAHPMTTGHLDYVDPTPEHLRFMYFCPIAYGAKGLIAFSYAGFRVKNFRSALIDAAGSPTENYGNVRRLNLFVARVVGPVVMRSTHVEVWHASDFPDHQLHIDSSIRESSGLIRDAEGHLLIGLFRGSENTYLLVVNKDINPVNGSSILLAGKMSDVQISPSVVDFDETTPATFAGLAVTFNAGDNATRLILPDLSGGEGRLIKLSFPPSSE